MQNAYEFQHEDWSARTPAAPSIAAFKPEALADMEKSVQNMFRLKNVREVLENAGAEKYWEEFRATVLSDTEALGNGSRYFQTCIRKLTRASAVLPRPPSLPVADRVVEAHQSKPSVRQKINQFFPTSYMPHPSAPIKEGSLLAVYLTEERRNELNLVGFHAFEPLIAKATRVLSPNSYECIWLESQRVNENVPDGLVDGYNGRWRPWVLEDGEPAAPAVLKFDDIYAANFKLVPGSDRICFPLKSALKKALEVFKEA